MDFQKTSFNETSSENRRRRPKARAPHNGQVSQSSSRNRTANPKAKFERYMALARTAKASGETIEAENYYQHAEHYFRDMNGQ
ncbi:MAG: hypothetical protein C0605_16355 [Hyphomicrobiales bacterium]|nr:MAG: hypothetical protein C0605_16355 [Hyphomicrobiales bacterium]